MLRGTTPKHIFKVGIDLTDAEVLYITYSQGDKEIVEKTISEIDIFPNKLEVRLTQKETLDFDPDLPVKIQIRGRYPNDIAVGSNQMMSTVEDILKDGEI